MGGDNRPREYYTCQECGYQWEGQAVQIVGGTGEHIYLFPDPQHCLSCELRVLPDKLVANLESAPYRYASKASRLPALLHTEG